MRGAKRNRIDCRPRVIERLPPRDNHFRGTDPFLVTDPTVERNWLQRTVMPYALHVILVFGVYGQCQTAVMCRAAQHKCTGPRIMTWDVRSFKSCCLFKSFKLLGVCSNVRAPDLSLDSASIAAP